MLKECAIEANYYAMFAAQWISLLNVKLGMEGLPKFETHQSHSVLIMS